MQGEERNEEQKQQFMGGGRTGETNPATGGRNQSEDFGRLKEWVQQARSDAERARIQGEQSREDIKDLQLELEGHGRSTRRQGWMTAVLALALIGASAYGFFSLQEHSTLLAQMPGVQNALAEVGQRMNAAEEAVREWASDWSLMSARVDKVEKAESANLRAAKDFASEQAAKVHHQVQAELTNRTNSLQAGLGRLGSTQEEGRAQLAELRNEVAGGQQEMTQQIAETQEQMRNLDGQIEFAQRDLDALNRQVDVRRLDFEVSKDHTREVGPGITLTVSDMNVSYQRVEGRIHVVSDGRILWIRGQGIQQPVRFFSHEDERAYELVFTRVNRDSAVGYLLMPRWPEKEASVADNPVGGETLGMVQ